MSTASDYKFRAPMTPPVQEFTRMTHILRKALDLQLHFLIKDAKERPDHETHGARSWGVGVGGRLSFHTPSSRSPGVAFLVRQYIHNYGAL